MGKCKDKDSIKLLSCGVLRECSLVEVCRLFGGPYCVLHQGATTSETSVNFYRATRHNIAKVSDCVALNNSELAKGLEGSVRGLM